MICWYLLLYICGFHVYIGEEVAESAFAKSNNRLHVYQISSNSMLVLCEKSPVFNQTPYRAKILNERKNFNLAYVKEMETSPHRYDKMSKLIPNALLQLAKHLPKWKKPSNTSLSHCLV